jgi:ribosomal protein S12 methylthiotransferase
MLVEGYGDGVSVGRTYRDAPEIDGLVFVSGELPLGEIVPVHIDGAMVYDLTATPVGHQPGAIPVTLTPTAHP